MFKNRLKDNLVAHQFHSKKYKNMIFHQLQLTNTFKMDKNFAECMNIEEISLQHDGHWNLQLSSSSAVPQSCHRQLATLELDFLQQRDLLSTQN